MTMNTTTGAAIVPTIWSSKFFTVLLSSLVMAESIDQSYTGDIRALGDAVNISSVPEFSAAAELAEGTAGVADNVTIASQQLVIDKRTYKDYQISDRLKLQSLEHMDKLRDKAVYAVMKRMQAVLLSLVAPPLSNAIAYDSLTTLALADILEAKELLDAGNVPEDNRVAVLGSAQANDLFNITGFVSRDFIPAGSPLTEGAINTPIAGFTPKMTTEAGNTSYFFHPSFMTMAVQKDLSVNIYDKGVSGERVDRVNVDILWGAKQLDGTRVVTIS